MFEHTQCSVAGGMIWSRDAQPLRVLPVIAASDHEQTGGMAFGHLIEAAAVLQAQGYAVIVLDGTQPEHALRNPGLQQLLDPAAGFAHSALPADIPADGSVATLPAARGMGELVAQAVRLGAHPLSLLWRYLRRHAVVMIHAPANMLATLMLDCEYGPIQFLPTAGRDTGAAWRDLRQFWKQTQLMPHLVAFRAADAGFDAGLRELSQAALEQLDAEPLAEQIDADNARQLRRWILQSLERAQCVYSPDYEPPVQSEPIRVSADVLAQATTSAQSAQNTARALAAQSQKSAQKPAAAAAEFDHEAAAAMFAAARQRMAAARAAHV